MVLKPLVYIAGPYSSDPVTNTRRAIEVGMNLWATGKAVPFIPHLSLFADLVRPMGVEAWYSYDLDVLGHCQALLRLFGDSVGADAEVIRARELEIPVFDDVEAILEWAFSSLRPVNG